MPRTNGSKRCISLGAILLIIASCDRDRPPIGPIPQPKAALTWSGPPLGTFIGPTNMQGPQYSTDVEFARIAALAPGFGGLFTDTASGILAMYLVDSKQEAAARAALAVSLTARGLSSDVPILVRQGQYDFRDLKRWKDQLSTPVLTAIRGATLIGASVVRNRVVIGISTEAARSAVLALVVAAGVPIDAIAIENTPPMKSAVALAGFVRPPYGGLQIERGSGGICTMGLTVLTDQPGRYGLTASHCADDPYGFDPTSRFHTQFYQPTSAGQLDSNFIGTEFRNPLFTRCASPAGYDPNGDQWFCRGSDALLMQLRSDMPYTTSGVIARTLYRSRDSSGSRIQYVGNPWFYVEMFYGYPWTPLELNKIGASSGWTYGRVDQNRLCFDAPDLTYNTVIHCSYYVFGYWREGDSGAPVFSWDGTRSQVRFFGILWGGLATDADGQGGNEFVMSPMGLITDPNELGALNPVCCP